MEEEAEAAEEAKAARIVGSIQRRRDKSGEEQDAEEQDEGAPAGQYPSRAGSLPVQA
jgi:hypothetical protein